MNTPVIFAYIVTLVRNEMIVAGFMEVNDAVHYARNLSTANVDVHVWTNGQLTFRFIEGRNVL